MSIPKPSHFFVKGKMQVRYRDTSGRFAKRVTTMTRVTVGVKHIPMLHKYKSFTLTFWTTEEPNREKLEEELVRRLEEEIGYNQTDWWFKYAIGYAEQEVMYDESLDGKTEFESR